MFLDKSFLLKVMIFLIIFIVAIAISLPSFWLLLATVEWINNDWPEHSPMHKTFWEYLALYNPTSFGGGDFILLTLLTIIIAGLIIFIWSPDISPPLTSNSEEDIQMSNNFSKGAVKGLVAGQVIRNRQEVEEMKEQVEELNDDRSEADFGGYW